MCPFSIAHTEWFFRFMAIGIGIFSSDVEQVLRVEVLLVLFLRDYRGMLALDVSDQ